MKITVLGGGSFGTAIANIASGNNCETILWLRDEARANEINQEHVNRKYLPDTQLHQALVATTDMSEAISDADLIFVSVPSKSFRKVVQEAKKYQKPGQYWISTTKGIEESGFSLMSEILTSELEGREVGVLSGPNLAKEVAKGCLTATVIASTCEDLRTKVQEVLSSASFRVYANTDMYGVELGGALKNIYAIISGMAAALELGENTKSMLITRSLAEMSRFAVELGANPMTFLGLAGVGDLIVTCTSPLSRNYRVGYALGKGESLEETVDNLGEVAEGVNTTRIIHLKAQEMQVEMPLVKGLYKIIYEKIPVEKVITQLMLRDQNSDVEFVLPRT
ncbi:NAD(P)H-dependent glycerol-3-phosphate dehydrogenase [Hahella ganghwensis]|uniref:NAD(P)H-dependent glycerol-3-phosphate dehydrogenase n=1 Tax=Hahella ganghwensis TaxID=286420 RepID=UPI00036F8897|nr:NAD(P)H-dependent glycerol-3-phosphate dehydrogenase [Hahella ganghwensis]